MCDWTQNGMACFVEMEGPTVYTSEALTFPAEGWPELEKLTSFFI